jgi:hypothetical protein
LLGSSRTGEAHDPEIYITTIVRVLSDYPVEIANWVAERLPAKVPWLPKADEVRKACEEAYSTTRYVNEWQRQTAKQLAERHEFERDHGPMPDKPKLEPLNLFVAVGMPDYEAIRLWAETADARLWRWDPDQQGFWIGYRTYTLEFNPKGRVI